MIESSLESHLAQGNTKFLFIVDQFYRPLLQSSSCVPGYKIMESFLGFIVTTVTITIIQYVR